MVLLYKDPNGEAMTAENTLTHPMSITAKDNVLQLSTYNNNITPRSIVGNQEEEHVQRAETGSSHSS